MKYKSVQVESDKTFRSVQQQGEYMHIIDILTMLQFRERIFFLKRKKGGLKKNMAKYFSYNDLFQDLSQLVMMSRKSKGLKHRRDLLIFLQFIIT